MLQEKVLFALTLGRRGSERDMASKALLLPFVLPLASTQLAKAPCSSVREDLVLRVVCVFDFQGFSVLAWLP